MIEEDVANKNIHNIVLTQFKKDLTPKQCEIVRSIVYQEDRRLSISAMTRYGKSLCIAIAISLYILLNDNKKIAIIAPKQEQTEIIRNYIVDCILTCRGLLAITELQALGGEKLKKEASKSRMTFRNGCEFRVFSAHGDASGLMGFGADLIIKDEAALISDEANTKIMRMLGDNAESSILVELFNPWSRETKAYDHWNDPEWHRIHIDWRTGLAEGRINETFLEEMRKEMTPIEFTVLYESQFPDETEDSLFKYAKIMEAVNKEIEMPKKEKVMGCDIAAQGLDYTVLMKAFTDGQQYKVFHIYDEPKSEAVPLAGKILNLADNFYGETTKQADYINIDAIGVGWGVYEILKKNKPTITKINPCHFGNSASNTKRFINKKAQMYSRLSELFNAGYISIPDNKKLIRELLAMRYEFNEKGQMKIIDPEKSPDYADALVFTTWKQEGNEGFFIA